MFLSSISLKIFPLEKSCTDCLYQSSHRLSNLFLFFFFLPFLGFTSMSSLKVPQAISVYSTKKKKKKGLQILSSLCIVVLSNKYML